MAEPAIDVVDTLDYREPDYTELFRQRTDRLKRILADPGVVPYLREHYRKHPWDFIADWGMTFEPRNIERNLISSIPFVPWSRQVEFLEWLYRMWRGQERGLVEKSRDCGVTWLCVGFAVSMWLFEDGFTTGFGSRKEELVDKRGDSKCIFEKVRFFIDNVPAIFMPPDYAPRTCSAHMRIINPNTGAAIIGEAGDEIGRGGRCSIYLVDEAAFIEHQDKVDAALSQNTNCQIDVSTPNGNGNAFYHKRMRLHGSPKLFIFDWKHDPRKNQAWYDKQVEELDEVIVAQEIDRDYNASQEDSFIPAKWVAAAIDAHEVLGFEPSGVRAAGFDPADTGDAKAAVDRWGSIVTEADQKTTGDITQAIPFAFRQADRHRADVLKFDGDGMGAPAMKLSLQNMAAGRMKVVAYHGSGEIEDPDRKYGKPGHGRSEKDLKTNAESFLNYKAQTWTWVRDRFHATFVAVQRAKKGQLVNVAPEELISIDSRVKCLHDLQAELSRPLRIFTNNGKIRVESKKEMRARGVMSPNLAEALVMAFSVKRPDPVKRRLPYRPYRSPL